jgi:hypothetical protein
VLQILARAEMIERERTIYLHGKGNLGFLFVFLASKAFVICISCFHFQGIMTAFGDAHETSIDSIRVAEGLLAHFVKVCDPQLRRPLPYYCILRVTFDSARRWRCPGLCCGPDGSEPAGRVACAAQEQALLGARD